MAGTKAKEQSGDRAAKAHEADERIERTLLVKSQRGRGRDVNEAGMTKKRVMQSALKRLGRARGPGGKMKKDEGTQRLTERDRS